MPVASEREVSVVEIVNGAISCWMERCVILGTVSLSSFIAPVVLIYTASNTAPDILLAQGDYLYPHYPCFQVNLPMVNNFQTVDIIYNDVRLVAVALQVTTQIIPPSMVVPAFEVMVNINASDLALIMPNE